MVNIDQFDACPCGSRHHFGDCCQPIHQDPLRARTPQALMRARFAAFALGDVDTLLATWDASTRPSRETLEAVQPRWLQLAVEDSASQGQAGWVRFTALGREAGHFLALHETSRFRFDAERNQWFYVDGEARWQRLDIGRNAPCPCGSGLKAKRCCARD